MHARNEYCPVGRSTISKYKFILHFKFILLFYSTNSSGLMIDQHNYFSLVKWGLSKFGILNYIYSFLINVKIIKLNEILVNLPILLKLKKWHPRKKLQWPCRESKRNVHVIKSSNSSRKKRVIFGKLKSDWKWFIIQNEYYRRTEFISLIHRPRNMVFSHNAS